VKLQQILPVLLALFALVVFLYRRSARRGQYIDPESHEWSEAITKAQASIPILRQLHESGVSPLLIKYAVLGSGGELEHVWGELRSIGSESFTATLETPMLYPPASLTPPFSLPLSTLEDWQAFLPDGSIRGGYTTQAEIGLYRQAGKKLPPHIAAMQGHFVDG
jgi:hypothetical protein